MLRVKLRRPRIKDGCGSSECVGSNHQKREHVTGTRGIHKARDLSRRDGTTDRLAAAPFFRSQESEYVRDFAQLLPFVCAVQRGAADR